MAAASQVIHGVMGTPVLLRKARNRKWAPCTEAQLLLWRRNTLPKSPALHFTFTLKQNGLLSNFGQPKKQFLVQAIRRLIILLGVQY